MRRFLTSTVVALSAAVWAPAGLSSAGEPDQAVLARARGARARAEKDLAAARRRILAERKVLAGELQKAYAALAGAEARAKVARASLGRHQLATTAAERDVALIGHRTRAMIAQAAGAAGATVGPGAPIDAMEPAIWEGFQRRLNRLEGDMKLSVGSENVVGRDGNERRVRVVRLGSYAAYACGAGQETCGLLKTMPDGRRLVAGPHLSAEQARALRTEGDRSHLPIDVDGSLLDRAPAGPKSLGTWLSAGGMFIVPILVVGALGLILVLERIGYLLLSKAPPPLMADVLSCLERRDVAAARERLVASRTPTGRVLLAGIESMGQDDDQREAAMESALLAEAPRLERSLSLLGALAGVAPLLGLLGTVSGMIATFDTISTAGTSNPRLLSGGISEALITTQLGLMVAIPLLLAHAWLRRWVERREALLEYSAVQVSGIRQAKEGGSK